MKGVSALGGSAAIQPIRWVADGVSVDEAALLLDAQRLELGYRGLYQPAQARPQDGTLGHPVDILDD